MMIFNQSEFDLSCEWGKQGGILSYLSGSLSPEAEAAVAVFNNFKNDFFAILKKCSSGKELIARGFESDVELAAMINVSDCVPVFTQLYYVRQSIF